MNLTFVYLVAPRPRKRLNNAKTDIVKKKNNIT
jgi:hypothetical protein